MENNDLQKLYSELHQIAGDIRAIKTVVIIGFVCGILLVALSIWG